MDMTVWDILSRLRQAHEPLAWWKRHLGAEFDGARRLLTPCEGEAGHTYPCPDTGLRLQIRETDGRYIAFPTGDEAEDADDLALSWEDVQAWRLDHAAFRRAVAGVLDLSGGGTVATPGVQDGDIQLAGFCDRHGARRRVYLCHADGNDAAARAAADTARTPEAGCLVFAERHAGAEHVLKARGVALVALAEGGCGAACRAKQPDLSAQMKAGFESVKDDKIQAALREQEKQRTIEDMAEGADKFLAGLTGRLSDKERQLFFLLIARVADGARRRVMTLTEIGVKLGGLQKQTVDKRVQALYGKQPSVEDYVQAIRKPKKAENFSEMSPSERRKMGVDKSYNYDAG